MRFDSIRTRSIQIVYDILLPIHSLSEALDEPIHVLVLISYDSVTVDYKELM